MVWSGLVCYCLVYYCLVWYGIALNGLDGFIASFVFVWFGLVWSGFVCVGLDGFDLYLLLICGLVLFGLVRCGCVLV